MTDDRVWVETINDKFTYGVLVHLSGKAFRAGTIVQADGPLFLPTGVPLSSKQLQQLSIKMADIAQGNAPRETER